MADVTQNRPSMSAAVYVLLRESSFIIAGIIVPL